MDRGIEGGVGIVGAGRAGTGLALALVRAGQAVSLVARRAVPLPNPLTVTVAADGPGRQWVADHLVLVLAVPDDAILPAAQSLARTKGVGPDHVVLHLSGVLGQEALAPLVSSRAALGSLHPLQTFADPIQAPDRLRGAWAAVEGTPRAVELAEQLAALVGMRPFRITGKTKALYHASAVFASNYLVVVETVAQRLLRHTGLSDADAWAALRPLVEGTVANMMRGDPRDALTGPVVRGDTETILKHLNALTIDDAKLYQGLGRAALELARKRGMDEATAQRVADALATDLPRVLQRGE